MPKRSVLSLKVAAAEAALSQQQDNLLNSNYPRHPDFCFRFKM